MNETNDAARNKTRRRYSLRWIIGTIILLFVIAAILAANQYRDVAIINSEETTLYTTPLKENGDVDLLAAFEAEHDSPDLATEANGFRMILQNMKFSEGLLGDDFKDVCKRLGLDPTKVHPNLNYTDPYYFFADYFNSTSYDETLIRNLAKKHDIRIFGINVKPAKLVETDVNEILTSRCDYPWTLIELPMMNKWLEENHAVLDLVGKAVRKPAFEFPINSPDPQDGEEELLMAALFYTQEFRSIARGYVVRANYYLGHGEVRRAVDDVISCKRIQPYFYRHVGLRNGSASLVERLIGVAIEGLADSVGVVNTFDDKTSVQDLKYFASELKNIPQLGNLDKHVLFEKLVWLDLLRWASRRRIDEDTKWLYGTQEVVWFRNLGIDWNIAAKSFNQTFDTLWKKIDWEEDDDIKVEWQDYISRSSRSKKVGEWFAKQTYGYAMLEAEHRTRCSQNLKQITLAMLIYEKEKGRLPPAFSTDQSGKPLHRWRVLLLPYLGEQELFDQIRLDEPWDSKHNSQFVSKCPALYACPSCKDCKSGQTSYSVILGKDLPFEGAVGKELSEFSLQSNDMILVAERIDPINWMDPEKELTHVVAELGINADNPYYSTAKPSIKSCVGSSHPAGSQFGFRNGSVNFLSETIESDIYEGKLRGTNRSMSEE